jgi:HK97 family phage major capsid protein
MGKTLLESLREQRKAKRADLDKLVPAEGEERAYSQEDDTRAGALLAEIAGLDTRIGELSELEQREDAAASARKETGETETRERGGATTNEPLTYTRESAQGPDKRSFFSDAYRAQYMFDRQAADRIARHCREMEIESRDVGTPAMGGLIPPQYLLDQFAPLVYAGRPVANAVANLPLPSTGMTLDIPRGTTGTAVDVQAAENTALVEQDYDETTLTVPVITIGGQQDVSRQSLERGNGTDQIIFADLVSNYAVKVDQEVIAGDGAGGDALGILNTSGINAVTYTDASPTLAELWPKIADGIARVQAGRYLPPTAIFMHPRRWAMMSSALDSTGRPLINTTSPQNAVGIGDALKYGQVVGSIQGVPVITDGNIPVNLGVGTNEDVIIIARTSDCLLFENSTVPRELRFEETLAGQLTVKLVVYGYMAFTAGRYPKGITTITGTGLITPTF